MEWLGIFCGTKRKSDRIKERGKNPNKRTSNHKRVSDAIYPTQKFSDVSKMTIQEDAVLEALCEMTNIEPEKANSKILKVTGKERKKLFQKFSMHQETEDLFNDENKMKEFMRNITGNSKRDREINDGIERTSVRVSQSRISVGSVSRNSFQSLNKIGTQNTQNSRINLEDELKMHREYRQKQISQQNALQQSRGSKTSVATKKSPMKNNHGPSDKRDRIVEVTRESYSEYNEVTQ